MSEWIRVLALVANLGVAEPSAMPCCDAPASAMSMALAPPVRFREPAGAERARQPAADAWFGSDKLPHFWMSYATTAFVFAAASAADQEPDAALMAGLGAGAVAAIGKEVHDWRRGWTFSVKDLTADALGLAAAYFFLREVR